MTRTLWGDGSDVQVFGADNPRVEPPLFSEIEPQLRFLNVCLRSVLVISDVDEKFATRSQ